MNNKSGTSLSNGDHRGSSQKKSWTEKYGNALKIFIPVRCLKERVKNAWPNNDVGLISYVSVNWMTKTMWKASRQMLEPEDIKEIGEADGVNVNSERLMRLWNDELRRSPATASLHRTVWRFNRCRQIMAAIMMVLVSIFAFLGPAWGLEYMLHFLTDRDAPLWHGLVLALALSLSQLLSNVSFNAFWIIGTSAGIRVTGALQVMIYEKIFRIKGGGEKLLAEVINYSSSDIERIFQGMQMSMFALSTPLMFLMNVVYCYQLMGPWSLLGNALVFLYYPTMILFGNLTSSFRMQAMWLADKRIGLINQALSNVKQIKMYVWEERCLHRIKDIRRDEENVLFKSSFLQAAAMVLAQVISTLAPMLSIIGYVLWEETLTSVQAFVMMSSFSALLLSFGTLANAVRAFSEGAASCKRIQELMLTSDIGQPASECMLSKKYAISIQNANISWDDNINNFVKPQAKQMSNTRKEPSMNTAPSINLVADSKSSLDSVIIHSSVSSIINICRRPQEILTNINLKVKKGQLLGICGSIGSGKSVLLAAISGNANVIEGKVGIQGSVALSTQQAWIFNATVQENILFGLPYDDQKYKFVINACCLEDDISLFCNGDKMEISERGANLSGGQKQRISLARALYSDRDIYLLDDVFSFVDGSVSKHIFENCIKKGLRHKTVLLVSHAVHILEQCDQICLIKDGELVENGTHQALINQRGEYHQLVNMDKIQREEFTEKKKLQKNVIIAENSSNDGVINKSEIDNNLSLTWKSWLYFCKMSGGYCISFVVLLNMLLFTAICMFTNTWLKLWLDAESGIVKENNATAIQNITVNPQLRMHLGVFGASGILMLLFAILKAYVYAKVILTGSSAIHHAMFWKVIRSPMSFFDTTPLGRIINRFSKDMDECDNYIPHNLDFVLQTYLLLFIQLILIGVLYPWYFLGLCVFVAIFIAFDVLFTPGVRSIKRVENLLRSPLLVHMSATVQGLPIIRCYRQENMFSAKFRTCVDKHLSAYLLFQLSLKWIAFRCDIITWLFLSGVGILIILSRETKSPAAAGLAMLLAFRIIDTITICMRWKSELCARLISIERISDYCKHLIEEAPASVNDTRPSPAWPTEGTISFKNVQMRYRPELPLILQGIDVNIKGGEKVGIVGRTGAGKSSIFMTLLRLTETCSGLITIDGVDISKIGLKELRSKMSVIAQDPVLFPGTIRWNLDPLEEFKDDAIWVALEKAHLKEKIIKEPQGLCTPLDAEGGMYSAGEKQLFCLARALIRNSKILLMDEATASVDIETDQFIQKSIRNAFSHCTILTIAHRLNTISDYDKIMVIDAGKVIEFDSPANLIEKDSVFRAMMTF